MPANRRSPGLTEELEKRFIALVYVKNSLSLRQTAVATDIGIQLELLTSKLRLYMRDTAILETVHDDINSIKQESLDQQFDIHFYALEYLPSTSPYDSSMLEMVQEIFREARSSFDKYKESRAAALQFMKDPQALLEGRLGKFPLSQR